MYILYYITENLQISTIEVETLNNEIILPENLLFISLRKDINFINEPSKCLPFNDIERLAIANRLDDLSLFQNHSFRLKNSIFSPLCSIDPYFLNVVFENSQDSQNNFFIPYSVVNSKDESIVYFTRSGDEQNYQLQNTHQLPQDEEFFRLKFHFPTFSMDFDLEEFRDEKLIQGRERETHVYNPLYPNSGISFDFRPKEDFHKNIKFVIKNVQKALPYNDVALEFQVINNENRIFSYDLNFYDSNQNLLFSSSNSTIYQLFKSNLNYQNISFFNISISSLGNSVLKNYIFDNSGNLLGSEGDINIIDNYQSEITSYLPFVELNGRLVFQLIL